MSVVRPVTVPAAITSHSRRARTCSMPSQADAIASTDTCVQCHSQGQPRSGLIEGKAYDWPVGYHVGLRLQDYWKLEPHTLGETNFTHYADGTCPQEPDAGQ